MSQKTLKKIFQIALYLFALIGVVFTFVYIAMQFGWLNVRGANTTRNASLGVMLQPTVADCSAPNQKICEWNQTTEWSVIKQALQKDASVIARVSNETGVNTRMIVAAVIPEQARFFVSNRESFKRYFEPLKILGSLSKFSLGVSGIKQETAVRIEQYAQDTTSPFYPGPGIADLVKYTDGANHDSELYNRLTDAKDHYYSYLYTALYLKEISTQWKNSGYDVSHTPEVLVTLFNLGFDASHPNANPQVAGSTITLGGRNYSFGELGTMFYNSSELIDIFPR